MDIARPSGVAHTTIARAIEPGAVLRDNQVH
jgi:hypothetical protein